MDTSKHTVFLSYAWESDDYKRQVRQLRDELSKALKRHGTRIVSDIDIENRPPAAGLQAWMQHSVEDADVVLVLCSASYKNRFEKRATPDRGKGVAWEGAIITADLYDAAQHNVKFYPVLPDGVEDALVPKALRPWSYGHRFPSATNKIVLLLKECFGVRSASTPKPRTLRAAKKAPVSPEQAQEANLVDWLLGDDIAPLLAGFYAALNDLPRIDLQRQYDPQAVASSVVQRLAAASGEQQVFAAISMVSRAWHLVRSSASPDKPTAPAIQDGLIDLYRLAVRTALIRARSEVPDCSAGAGKVLRSHTADVSICALLAGEVLGGKLKFSHDLQTDTWLPTWTFRINSPANGEQTAAAFEREAFRRLCKPTSAAQAALRVERSLHSAPLDEDEAAELEAEIHDKWQVFREVLVFIDDQPPQSPGSIATRRGAGFAAKYGANVVVLDQFEDAHGVLAVSEAKLLARIRQWFKLFDPPGASRAT